MALPSALVLSLLAMLPRLEAEEAQAAVNRGAMAAGTMPADQQSAMFREWAETARPEPDAAPRKTTPEALAAHGIPVRKVKRPRAEAKA